MNASAAIADTPLRQACARIFGVQAGGLAASTLNVLFKDASGLRGSTRPSRRRLLDFATNHHG